MTSHRRPVRLALAGAALAVVAATAPAVADVTDWKLSKKGLGPVRVGRTVAEVEAITGYQMKPSYGSRSCKIWTLDGAPEGISIMTANGKVVRVSVFRRPWQTLLGLHVGTKESAVRRHYPHARVRPHPYTPGGHYVIAGGKPRRLIFETGRKHRVTSIRGGLTKYVNYIEGCA